MHRLGTTQMPLILPVRPSMVPPVAAETSNDTEATAFIGLCYLLTSSSGNPLSVAVVLLPLEKLDLAEFVKQRTKDGDWMNYG